MDILIIGAGLSGAVIAHEAAQAGWTVLVIEEREHVGGHIYDQSVSGVMTHVYGPHIFHTNDESVYRFMSQFWKLNGYHNRVLGQVDQHLIPIPFNFTGVDRFFPDQAEQIKNILTSTYGTDKRVTIGELRQNADPLVQKVADFVYRKIFANYTRKMWGKDPSELDPSVLARVPVTIGYQDRYFFDKYEGLPIEGYTKSVEKMLAHKNIKVILKTDASNLISFRDGKIYYRAKQVKVPLVYTGPIDHLFNYRYGLLEYRSLDIKVQTLARDQFQPVGVVNYPADPTMTRISEYKHMTGQKVVGKTVITREYPGAYQPGSPRFGTRYYPMMTDQAKVAYQKYQELARQYPNLHLVGRLATFKYINMDQAVKIALEKAAQLLGKAPS